MAYFQSPCQKSVLVKPDAASMPTIILSIYLEDYISPAIRKAMASKILVAKSKPPDYLPVDAGKRILPTSFRDLYRNCVSASIGELLELEFQDDTPKWKYDNRNAAAINWLQPLSDRRNFIKTQQWNRSRNKSNKEKKENKDKNDNNDDDAAVNEDNNNNDIEMVTYGLKYERDQYDDDACANK